MVLISYEFFNYLINILGIQLNIFDYSFDVILYCTYIFIQQVNEKCWLYFSYFVRLRILTDLIEHYIPQSTYSFISKT